VNWIRSTPAAYYFIPPSNCNPISNYTRANSYTHTYNSNLPVSRTMPTISNQFYMVLEGVFTGYNGPLTGAIWHYNGQAGLERVQTVFDSNSSTNIITYNYTSGLAYYSQGPNSNCVNFTIGRSVSPFINYYAVSPFINYYGGFLHDFFDPTFSYATNFLTSNLRSRTTTFNPSTAAYQGLSTIRGINNVPYWKYTGIQTNQTGQPTGALWIFDAYVYFYPQGWDFPLRNVDSGLQLPLAITMTGTVQFWGQTQRFNFNDTYNLYEYYPFAPNSYIFRPCNQQFVYIPLNGTTTSSSVTPPTSATTSNSVTSSNSLSTGAKAGIAIAAIVVAVGVVAAVIVVIRRKKISGPASVNGDNRSFATMQDRQ